LDIPVSLAKNSVEIADRNDYSAEDYGPKIAYYKVTATKCGNGIPDPTQTLTADPGIGNTGK
jgi:hypothetical protein